MSNNKPQHPSNEREFIALFACLTALTALSIDAILPGMPAIALELSPASYANTHLLVTAVVFGMMFGEPVFGPLSDAKGRHFSIFLGIAIFIAGSLLAALAQSMSTLLLARFIQGVGVAGPKIGSRAAIRDRFAGTSMAQAMSIIMAVLILVPMLAPALGELIIGLGGWRLIFIAYCLLSVAAASWLYFRQSESLPPERRTPFHWRDALSTTASIAGNANVLSPTLSAGLMFGCLTSYYGTAASIFGEIFNIAEYFTLLFAMLAASIGIASLINARLVKRFGMYRLSQLALYGLASNSALLLLISALFEPTLSVFLPLFAGCLFCIGILFGNLGAMAMEPLGAVAGIGASFIASVSSGVAVVVSAICGYLYNHTLIPLSLCFCLCAVLSLGLLQRVAASRP